mgnify:CR=1 FL=1
MFIIKIIIMTTTTIEYILSLVPDRESNTVHLFQYRYFGIGPRQYRNTGIETGIEIHYYARHVVQYGDPTLANIGVLYALCLDFN